MRPRLRLAAEAFAAGRATRTALHAAGVDLAFGPVLDTADGPLGSRQFRSGTIAVAFARGLGDAACVKHFPGLGSAAYSTDERPHVDAHVRPKDIAPFRAAIRAGVPCVMVGHAFYGTRYRASLEPSTYSAPAPARLRRRRDHRLALARARRPGRALGAAGGARGRGHAALHEPRARARARSVRCSRSHAAASSTVTSARILRLRR